MIELTEENWEEVMRINKMIGEYVGVKPEIEYSVGSPDGKSFCYSPKNVVSGWSAGEQKIECEKFLGEQKRKNWTFKDYVVVKQEHYPAYHRDMNELMKALDYLEDTIQARVTYKRTVEPPSRTVHIVTSVGGFREASAGAKDRHIAYYNSIKGFIESSLSLLKS